MRLLYAGGVITRNAYFQVAPPGKRATVAPENTNRPQPPQTSRIHRVPQVGGIAAGTEDNQQVACLPQAFDLPAEDLVESEIVADAGHGGTIRRQRDPGKRATVPAVPSDQFLGHVHRLGRTAAISSRQHTSAHPQDIHDRRANSGKRAGLQSQPANGGGTRVRTLANPRLHAFYFMRHVTPQRQAAIPPPTE